MTLARDPQSRFKFTRSIIRNGVETFGLLAKHSFLDPNNLDEADVVRIEVKSEQAGRPDLIANELYNSPVLDWVIVLFNKPLNPVNWPAAGTVIRAPSERVVVPNV